MERDPLLIAPSKITTAWTGYGASNYHLLVIGPGDWDRQIEHGALNRRGWVLQERLLSPRVLHFGKEQIFWECRNSVASEALPVPHTNDCSLGDEVFHFKRQILSDPDLGLDLKRKRWEDIISRYMRRVLTRPEDKLIAISGVAKVFQSVAEDEYLAGLWREDLPSQLLWSVESCRQANGLPSVKPHPYRAPSWPWASVDVNITWPYFDPDDQALITVQEAVVQPMTDDPTGQIRGGHIKLRGRVVKTEFRAEEEEQMWKIRIGDTTKRDVEISSDLPSAVTNNLWRQGYFLPTIWRPYDELVLGLLLHRVDAAQTVFERCGYFDLHGAYTGTEPKTLEMFGLRKTTDGESVEFVDQDALKVITLI
jgi:hypothetical protein